jgi:hypothetical protein
MRICMRHSMVAILTISVLQTGVCAGELPELRKTLPTVKKSVFSPHQVEVDYMETPSPFGSVPETGVHPRILISPEDLPALRDRLKNAACGRRSIAAIRAWNRCIYDKNNGALAAAYDALVAGDDDAFSKAENDWWLNQLGLSLCFAAFDAMVKDDAAQGQGVAKALATYAKLAGGVISPHGYKSVNPDTSLGFGYDFAYNYMDEEQRTAIRQVIAGAIAGKKPHGADSPPEGCTYNWMPHAMALPLLALAIEGEEGYDANTYTESVKVMRNFLVYGIYPDGVPTEGMHYFNFGMNPGSPGLVAMARRGDNLLGSPHYNRLKNWYIHSMEPFGYAFSMHGDTPNDTGGLLGNYVLMKKVFPGDPVIDFVWRNRLHDDYSGLTYRGDFLFAALFGEDWKGGSAGERQPVADQWGVDNADNDTDNGADKPWDAAALEQPLTLFSPYRGLMITRDSWKRDSLVMHFECRRDAIGPGHNHANQNDFTLSALGRKWAIDRGFHIAETKHHSGILIDGKGQGFFPAPGIIINQLDTPPATLVTGDAKLAYDHRLTFPGRVGNPENKMFQWRTPDFSDAAAAVDNPVRHAFRTAMLVRGDYPYVLICDDIQKDSREHVYEWLMQVESDLVLKSVDDEGAVLATQNADETSPELWVKVLEQRQTADEAWSDAIDPVRLETYRVKRSANTGSNESLGLGKRLVLASRAVSPDFKVLLYPRRPDAEVPQIERKDNQITVRLLEQTDVYTFHKTPSGRQGFSMVRNGGKFVLTTGLMRFDSPHLSFVVDTDGGKSAAPSIARLNDTVYVSGTGWKNIRIGGPEVNTIIFDKSVGEMRVPEDRRYTIELVESTENGEPSKWN